jgi:hypothetical protein
MHYVARGVVKIYSAGVVTRDRRIGSWSRRFDSGFFGVLKSGWKGFVLRFCLDKKYIEAIFKFDFFGIETIMRCYFVLHLSDF